MADTKALRARIKSANSTLHLTKAMGLVAASKIRRANEAMAKAKQYATAFQDVINLLTSCKECEKSPYMQVRDTDRTRLIVIAGDRGMAGGYNANIFRLIANMPAADIIPIGKRACDRFGKAANSSEDFTSSEAATLSQSLCRDFIAGEFDRLGIVSTKYVSIMTQEPIIQWVLPLTRCEASQKTGVVFEPNEAEVLAEVVPAYITGRLMAAIRESFASEVAARRMAMDSAGKNAQQMIDNLQLQYNRARQGAITQEITEIVAGSGN